MQCVCTKIWARTVVAQELSCSEPIELEGGTTQVEATPAGAQLATLVDLFSPRGNKCTRACLRTSSLGSLESSQAEHWRHPWRQSHLHISLLMPNGSESVSLQERIDKILAFMRKTPSNIAWMMKPTAFREMLAARRASFPWAGRHRIQHLPLRERLAQAARPAEQSSSPKQMMQISMDASFGPPNLCVP